MARSDPPGQSWHETISAGSRWRKASFCQSGECVEVARQDDMIIVRDSKERCTVLRSTVEQWRTFVQGVKAGEFDDL